MSDTSNVTFRPYVAAEDVARANFYALLSRLYAAAADQALIAAIAASPPLGTEDHGAPLPMAWSRLIAAASAVDVDAVAEEYEALFGGVGQARINLHASHHLTGFMMEKPLAEVRDSLRELGIARLEAQSVVEDHIAALFETMRLLILGSSDQSNKGITLAPQNVNTQRMFFERHISPWIDECCSKIVHDPLANFYRVVTQLTMSFMQVEREGFSISA